ncbi:hypothetical protein NE237_015972 [Protea cynaroides]|uniref:Uncharacterized protein n=1 Tax=Protea cynaroides TaxID=273540 RepID=A0A9Q0KF86_9MAGN|nr:hypothetical protein NE237_015972 [Protea cynaroides]
MSLLLPIRTHSASEMQRSIHSKHQSIIFEDLLSHHGRRVRASSLYMRTFAKTFSLGIRRSPFVRTTYDFSDLNHSGLYTPCPSRTQNHIVAARKNRRRTEWQRAAKTAVQIVSIIASSNLNVLPEPLGIVIREAFGGHGGGSGIWKGFGGGGFEGWGRRKSRVRLGLFRLLGICALVILLIISREPESDFACGVLGLFLLGPLIGDYQKAMKGWVLGFCSCALMVIWGLRREHLHICVVGLRVRSPLIKIARTRRR